MGKLIDLEDLKYNFWYNLKIAFARVLKWILILISAPLIPFVLIAMLIAWIGDEEDMSLILICVVVLQIAYFIGVLFLLGAR